MLNNHFPLHLPLDERTKIKGVIMCEQVKSLDISARNAVFIEKAPSDVIGEVADIIIGCVEIPSWNAPKISRCFELIS